MELVVVVVITVVCQSKRTGDQLILRHRLERAGDEPADTAAAGKRRRLQQTEKNTTG